MQAQPPNTPRRTQSQKLSLDHSRLPQLGFMLSYTLWRLKYNADLLKW